MDFELNRLYGSILSDAGWGTINAKYSMKRTAEREEHRIMKRGRSSVEEGGQTDGWRPSSTEPTNLYKAKGVSRPSVAPHTQIRLSCRLTINNGRNYEHKGFPFFRQPKEIGNFSVDCDKQFYNDNSQLKYYCNPAKTDSLNFDMKIGFNEFVNSDKFRQGRMVSIENVLKWVISHRHIFRLPNSPSNDKNLHTDFISWRGILTKVLVATEERNDSWIIAVSKFNDTFYLCEFETEKKMSERMNPEPRQEEMSYWGHKFEQFLVTSTPNGEPDDPSVPIDGNSGFCSVVRTRLESHSLVFPGEVDCVDISSNLGGGYIELKTSREISHPKQYRNFRKFKLLKWWAQSFLVGIPTIVCGFRDDDGIVSRLKTFKTMDLPKIAEELPDAWIPSVCANFFDDFLSFLKKSVQVDNPRHVYLFKKEAYTISVEDCGVNSEFTFLPDWYINELQ